MVFFTCPFPTLSHFFFSPVPLPPLLIVFAPSYAPSFHVPLAVAGGGGTGGSEPLASRTLFSRLPYLCLLTPALFRIAPVPCKLGGLETHVSHIAMPLLGFSFVLDNLLKINTIMSEFNEVLTYLFVLFDSFTICKPFQSIS